MPSHQPAAWFAADSQKLIIGFFIGDLTARRARFEVNGSRAAKWHR